MDVLHNLPPTQEGLTISESDYTGFALSLQGTSHKMTDPPIPCQDYSNIRYLKQENIILAAIADGVGSCRLSHWGAYTAVYAALDYAGQALEQLAGGKAMKLDSCGNEQMKEVLIQAFRKARDAVETLADETQQLPFNFQSTLTLAIYDGSDLFFGHAGDDGIVVQTQDGGVEMLTIRQKGDEMGSVYPLQSGEKTWHFGRAAKPVAAFLMATDGVLDAFVANRPDYYEINYCNGVCYAFMEDAVYTLGEKTPNAAGKALESYLSFLRSPSYQEQVTDDLTMIAIVSGSQLAVSKHPKFNMEIWNTIQRESNKARRLLLSHKPLPGAMPADIAFGIKEQQQKKSKPSEQKPLEQERREPEEWQPGGCESEMQVLREYNCHRQPRERVGLRDWIALLIVLLTIGAATGGFFVGRWFLPEIKPEEHQSIDQENQRLEETIQNESTASGITEGNWARKEEATYLKPERQQSSSIIKKIDSPFPEEMDTDEP